MAQRTDLYSMIITLTLTEIRVASQVGLQRQLEDIHKNKGSVFGESKDMAWQRHIEGALSECALAKYLNVYWNHQHWELPDVGEVDVRCTNYHKPDLILHDKDIDDRKYYLLKGINGTYKICGWLYGREGKLKKYWRELVPGRGEVYAIPEIDLHDQG